jgi:acetate kinase
MTAADCILVLNAGSSSLKFAVFRESERAFQPVCDGQAEGIGVSPMFNAAMSGGDKETKALRQGAGHNEALTEILSWLNAKGDIATRVRAAGHRIVHGGRKAIRPLRVESANLMALDELRRLAPLHNGFGLDAIHTLRALMPGIPQIACFDTAFHATQPDIATRLPLPQAFHDAGYRRYGFHGLNYEHVVAELPALSGAPLPERLLIFHLGNGSSICAVLNGRSVGTTMGYSTLDGLIMGTRSGNIDPGVLIALQRDMSLDVDALEDVLYRQSGLLGLSGQTSDMRTLLASTRPESRRAVDHYCHAAARHAASLLVALGGLDAMVFTGGIGANAPDIRQRIAGHLSWLGRTPVWVVPANEELAIARHVADVLVDA